MTVETMLGLLAVPIAAYVLYEVFLRDVVEDSRSPPRPLPDTVENKRALVCEDFTSPDAPLPRTGKVDLDGVVWSAESTNTEIALSVGDQCQVVSRNNLALVVDSLDAT